MAGTVQFWQGASWKKEGSQIWKALRCWPEEWTRYSLLACYAALEKAVQGRGHSLHDLQCSLPGKVPRSQARCDALPCWNACSSLSVSAQVWSPLCLPQPKVCKLSFFLLQVIEIQLSLRIANPREGQAWSWASGKNSIRKQNTLGAVSVTISACLFMLA